MVVVAQPQPQTIRAAAAEVLDGAARYIETGWCRFSTARGADNVPCAPTSGDAVCWCASGAIHVAARRSAPPQLLGTITETAQRAMVDAILETHPDFFDPGTLPMSAIASWNDHAEIGPTTVTERLRRAGALLRQPEAA